MMEHGVAQIKHRTELAVLYSVARAAAKPGSL